MFARLAVSVRARIAANIRARLQRTGDRLAERFTLPERYRGGLLEKWAAYWRQLGIDYGEVAAGCGRFARDRPLRTAVYVATGAGLYQAAKRNPSRVDYLRELRQQTGELVLVDERCQRPASREYLRSLELGLNEGRLRHLDAGIVSFIWLADYDEALALYKTTCQYTMPEWRTFGDRIVDVGFWGRWWRLRQQMEDYDVADE